MSGELQTIPARHGVATFVPEGRTIKIINTYGKQVVSTWAFSLNQEPSGKDDDGKKEKELKEELGVETEKGADGKDKPEEKDDKNATTEKMKREEDSKDNTKADDPPEQAPDDSITSQSENKKTEKKAWSSYLPSIPYRSKGQTSEKPDTKSAKEEGEATSKKWSSYLPTGKGFSTNLPNIQIPDSKGVISAFKASHYRDPNKSYAEQLYEFSKTPVGAASLAAATGSGTASSLYAAYTAYTKLSRNASSTPPMEYLSIPHTRTSTHHLIPTVDDTLLTNLRNPILTLVEDTTPGAHDTLTAACDANLYAALGVENPEEHGSCAENLVLALKELNEGVGLKGQKAIGADVTINNAPTPLHLFMNAPVEMEDKTSTEGVGAKGIKFRIEEPVGKKRGFVRFRAEKDIVMVMSACPMDVGKQNGGRCMAANFVVEEEVSEQKDNKSSTSVPSTEKSAIKASSTKQETTSTPSPKKAPPKLATRNSSQQKVPKSESPAPIPAQQKPFLKGGPNKFANTNRRDSAAEAGANIPLPPSTAASPSPAPSTPNDTPTPTKKRPKKLERRAQSTPKVEKTEEETK